jgi:hypothetical protein
VFADFCVAGVDAWWPVSVFVWLWCEANIAAGEVVRSECISGGSRSRGAAPIAQAGREVLCGLLQRRAVKLWARTVRMPFPGDVAVVFEALA